MMWCPYCGEPLDPVPVDEACPGCGGQRRDAAATPQPIRATIRPLRPTIVSESNLNDGRRKDVVSGPDGHFESETAPDGTNTQIFRGRPSQHEENVRNALHRMADTLNGAGSRVWREEVGSDDPAVDGKLVSSSDTVLCQVTRVERRTLPERGRSGLATASATKEVLADAIVEAVRSKSLGASPSITLILDTNDAPAYTQDAAISDDAHGKLEHAGQLGKWREIWLVGPTTARTRRLDP